MPLGPIREVMDVHMQRTVRVNYFHLSILDAGLESLSPCEHQSGQPECEQGEGARFRYRGGDYHCPGSGNCLRNRIAIFKPAD